MGIVKGQPFTAETFNNAFMSKNGNSTTTGYIQTDSTENATSETTGSIRTKGGIGVAKDLFVKGLSTLAELFISKLLRLGVQIESTLTGADANLSTYTAPIVVLTNASLTSIANIGLPASGKVLILLNRTGAIFILKPGDIVTPDGGNFPVANNSMVLLIHNPENSKFHVMSGGGSGVPNGGTTGQALLKNSNTDGDADWSDIPGMVVTAVQTLTFLANTITVQPVNEQRVLIKGSVNNVVATMPNGTIAGQKVYITGDDDNTPCAIQDTSNIYSNGFRTYYKRKTDLYIWNAVDSIWEIVGA